MHERRRGCILCCSIEYTLDGAKTDLQADLFSEPSHRVVVLFLLQADSSYFHIQPSFAVFRLACSQDFV